MLYFDLTGLAEPSPGATCFLTCFISLMSLISLEFSLFSGCFLVGGGDKRLTVERMGHRCVSSWAPVRLLSDVSESFNRACSRQLNLVCDVVKLLPQPQSTGWRRLNLFVQSLKLLLQNKWVKHQCVHIFIVVLYFLLSGTGCVSAHPDVHRK